MNWSAFPFFRIAILLIIGILISKYLPLSLDFCVFLLIGLSLVIIIINKLPSVDKLRFRYIADGCFAFVFVTFGLLSVSFHQSRESKKWIDEEYVSGAGILIDQFKSANKLKFLLQLETIHDGASDILLRSEAKVIIVFDSSDVLAKKYQVGQGIVFEGKVFSIKKTTNPASFDYSLFMATKGIYQTVHIAANHHKEFGNVVHSFHWLAMRARVQAIETLKKYIFDPNLLGIAEAILTGQKMDLSQEVYQDFADTGAIHVLAVSGLHVAIFINFFIWAFDKIKSRSLAWKLTKSILLIVIVWFYVFLTGMSPSVIRAGMMVSIYIVGKYLFRSSNAINTISMAAVIMLIFNPDFLFQASFQFSFLSLLSILYFYPKISKWLTPISKIPKWLWEMTAVTLSAQILIFPLSIFYFHQFPVYFLFSSILAIPLASFIIYVGSALLMFEYIFHSVNVIFSPILNWLLQALHSFISYLNQLPFNKITDIYLDKFGLILAFLSIIFFIIWLEKRQIRVFYLFLLVNMALVAQIGSQFVKADYHDGIYVYDIYGGTLIDNMAGKKLTELKLGNISENNIHFAAYPNRLLNHCLNPTKDDSISSWLKIENRLIYVLKSTDELENLKPIQKINVLIIAFDGWLTPSDVLQKLNPEVIVLTRAVSKKNRKSWVEASKVHNFKIHDVSLDGAFSISN